MRVETGSLDQHTSLFLIILEHSVIVFLKLDASGMAECMHDTIHSMAYSTIRLYGEIPVKSSDL